MALDHWCSDKNMAVSCCFSIEHHKNDVVKNQILGDFCRIAPRSCSTIMFDHLRGERSQTVVKAIYLPFKKGGKPLKCEFAVGYAPLWIHVSPSILVESIIATSGFLKFGCYSYPKTIGFPLGVFQIHKPRSSYKLLVYIHPLNCKCMESIWRFPKMGVPPNHPVYRSMFIDVYGRIFHEINHPAIAVPAFINGTPHIEL